MFIFPHSEGRKSEIMMLAGLVSPKVSVLHSQIQAFSLCSHKAFSLGSLPLVAVSSVIGLGSLWPHLILRTFLKALSPNIVILGIRASIYEFGEYCWVQGTGGFFVIEPPGNQKIPLSI